MVYGGTATFTEVDGSYSSVYDHFYFDDGLNSYGYDVDGTWLQDVGQFTFDLTATLRGDWGPASEATVTYATARTSDDPDDRVEGYADIISQPNSGATGDLCVSDAYEYVDSCDSEGDELVSLWGTTPATVTWNGSTNCDGCADVTIDGVAAGAYCPE